jgi:ABC-2 type transport system ATP-binding protein
MHIFGFPVPQELPRVMKQVGAVVEAPKFSPHLTGRQNLSLLSCARRDDRTRVDNALPATAYLNEYVVRR